MVGLFISLLLGLFVLPFPTTTVESSPSKDLGKDMEILLEVPDDVDSFLKNAATAMESYAVSKGSYEGATWKLLREEGLRLQDDIDLRPIATYDLGYCLEATAASNGFVTVFYYDSTVHRVQLGTCGH